MSSHDEPERDSEKTPELHHTEQNGNHGAFGLDQPHFQRDHCELLLDAIDAQLDQLQVQPQKHEKIMKDFKCSVSPITRWNPSPLKDRSLGYRIQTNDTPGSCIGFIHTPRVQKTDSTSEERTHTSEDSVIHKDIKKTLDTGTGDNEEVESRREQVIWRLERLLGDVCVGNRIAGETQPPSDSVCTEDFVRRFKEEMVELVFPETNLQQLEIEDEAQRAEISKSETFPNKLEIQGVLLDNRRGPVMTWKSSGATAIAQYSQSSSQRKELTKCLSENYGVNKCMLHGGKKPGPIQRYKAPQTANDDDCRCNFLTQSVRGDYYADLDTLPQEETVRKAQCLNGETCRLGCSYNDNDKNTDEDVTQHSSWCSTKNKAEKFQRQREPFVPESPQTSIMSVLERKEMERQLDGAKSELFAEQRRAREKLESIQEKLEETCEELQRATEAESLLRNKCSCLEEKEAQKKEQIEELEAQVSYLRSELGECKRIVGTLEKMLGQKEQQRLDFQQHLAMLQAERDGFKEELKHLKTQHYKTLKEAQDQTHRMKLKEEEAELLKKSLEKQRQEAKNHEEELHVVALKKVQKAITEEKRKWEEEKVEAFQVHCEILEEQNRKSLHNMKSEIQEERSKVLELKIKVQELEQERCEQQTEQEHQAELEELQKQESQRTVLRLERAVQLAEEEAARLRVSLERRESSHEQTAAELDQQLRNWAQELGAECQQLQLILEKSGAKQSAMQLPPSPSASEALTNLRTLRKELKNLIGYLQQELESQKQTTEQLKRDKEQELRIQRQQLRMERAHAMDFVKERLIQAHIEELINLNWISKSGGGAEDEEVAATLCKQLKSKDLELRQVKRNMTQWKEQNAAHLACKFEDVLTAELGRKTLKNQLSEGPEGDMTFSAKEGQNVFCPHAVDNAASYSPSDKATFKLLCYLQSRVRQLRVENQAHTLPPNTMPLDLNFSGSHLKTITQGQNSAGISSHSSTRTVSS